MNIVPFGANKAGQKGGFRIAETAAFV